MKISGVAKGQYKQECPFSWSKCKGNEEELNYKIKRAVDLGKVTHVYKNRSKIIRYYNKNFLVSDNEVMVMWTDNSREAVEVDEKTKKKHKLKGYKVGG